MGIVNEGPLRVYAPPSNFPPVSCLPLPGGEGKTGDRRKITWG
ncbi:hypothetical protein [Okeania hirsuta]|nr:hypothetical protein [Okeania hirsuta]